MKHICPTCGTEFEGEHWKKQCYDCYKNFKGLPRIEIVNPRKGVFIHAHPSVTKEEVDKFILNKFGSVNCPSNWGAVEVIDKRKLWYNCQNDD